MCDIKARSLQCSLLLEHGNKYCEHCKMAYRIIKCYSKTSKWFKFDKGNRPVTKDIIRKIMSETGLKVKSNAVFPELPISMQFTIDDKVNKDERSISQFRIANEWIEKGYGQIVCPPRSGKTLICAIISSKLQTRTAIIIHQKELLEQFYNTFINFTDIREKSKIVGHELIKINPSPDEVEKLSVVLYTWQQFISDKGKERLGEVRKLFGLITVDEAHRMSSDIYSDVVSRFKARYKCGLTATPDRKDKLDFRQTMILGPPIIKGGTEQLSCIYSIIDTGWNIPSYKEWNNKTWNYFHTALTKDKKRNKLIVEYVKEDLESGHKIIIPVKRIAHAEILTELIRELTDNVITFISSVKDRKIVSEDIRNGKYDVVVATKQMISLGFDAPKMSCLYCVVPTFDKNSFYQEYSRIRTPSKDKQTPLIRLFKDEGGICEAFLKKSLKEFKDKGFQQH